MQETFSELLDEYENWIKKKIELNSDWIEEIEYLIWLRANIHDSLTSANQGDLKRLTELDQNWQEWCLEHKDPKFTLESDRSNQPRINWWQWIDRLTECSPFDRITL